MGIQSGSGNLGVGLAYLTVGFLAQRWGWRTPLFVWALFGLVLAGLGALALRGVSSRSEERPSLRPADWWRSLRAIGRFVPGFFFGGAGWSVAVYYAPSLLNHKYGIPMGQTGLFLALWIGLGTVTGYGYGTLEPAASAASPSSWPASAARPRPSSSSAWPRPRLWRSPGSSSSADSCS